MRGLLSQNGPGLKLAGATILLTVAAALVASRRSGRNGTPSLPAAARILAIGCAVTIVIVTAFPRGWPSWEGGGDLALRPGVGGLRASWTELSRFPGTLASILVIGNVVLYVPLAFTGVLGWSERSPGWVCSRVSRSVSRESLPNTSGSEGWPPRTTSSSP